VPVISALKRLRQKDREFEDSLAHTVRIFLKKKKNTGWEIPHKKERLNKTQKALARSETHKRKRKVNRTQCTFHRYKQRTKPSLKAN
jgi:hypothetical protein